MGGVYFRHVTKDITYCSDKGPVMFSVTEIACDGPLNDFKMASIKFINEIRC